MRRGMHQINVVRDVDNRLTGAASYRVLECFDVFIDLSSPYYNGRRVWRVRYKDHGIGRMVSGVVLFSDKKYQKGAYISLRDALGIKKAGRA